MPSMHLRRSAFSSRNEVLTPAALDGVRSALLCKQKARHWEKQERREET
jgi:hypothetical protein